MFDPKLYDGTEVHPIIEWPDETPGAAPGDTIAEPCDGEGFPPSYWSVYLHCKEGGVECIADCPDEETANFIALCIDEQMNF